MKRRLTSLPTTAALFVLGLSIYLLTLPADLRNNADTVDRFFVTRALLHGSVYVSCNRTDTRIVPARYGCSTIYAAGQSVMMLPLYVAGKIVAYATGLAPDFTIGVFVRSLDPVLGALVLVFFYLLTLLVGYRKRTALLLTLLLAFASTLWPDVQSGQEQTQVALALTVAVYAVLRALKTNSAEEPSPPRVSSRQARPAVLTPTIERMKGWRRLRSLGSQSERAWLCTSGMAAGFGLLTRYDFAIDVLVLAGLIPWLFRQPSASDRSPTDEPRPARTPIRTLYLFAIGVAPFLILDAVWNTVRFGAPWRVGESVRGQLGFPPWQGAPNLLVSPGKGLVWYLPLLLLTPFVFRRFCIRAPAAATCAVAFLVVSLLFYGDVVYWHGDPAWGPRYLFPVVPLLLLPLGELFESFSGFRPPLRVGTLVVVGLALAVQLTAVGVDPWRFWYHLIQERQRAGQLFQWKPDTYNYYWSTRPDFDPELYQFVALRDVFAIGLGDHGPSIRESGPDPLAPSGRPCLTITPATHRPYDACQLPGVSLRPLNTISPIWLNDRYQWLTPLPVPLSLSARAIIVAFLLAAAAVAGGVLHLQFRQVEQGPRGRVKSGTTN